ncbi:phosphomevalonate kinase [Alloscardovia omnicolens]|uniref:phosphomevalonate kinase n=1 Tax=Alloscardovia omnicolens TaxID=419015 RepID=UPI003A75C87A
MAKGKLYICGEYAVVDGGAAVVAAVDRHLRAVVSESDDAFMVCDVTQRPSIRTDDSNRYVKAAFWIAARYLGEEGVTLAAHTALHIESELVEADGRKYGLGSSGAVTVAVLEALLEPLISKHALPAEHIYKLAVLALQLVHDNGSGGDIACSAFGQLIYYVRPDQDFVCELGNTIDTLNLHEIVNSVWPQLVLDRLQWPMGIQSFIAWTGSPASSAELVQAVRSYKTHNSAAYSSFVRESTHVSQAIREACRTNNAQDFVAAYAQAGDLLTEFSRQTGDFMNTPELKKCVRIAQEHGCVAKFSGAGGGDCAIALTHEDVDGHALRTAWNKAGIMPMDWHLG